MIVQSNYRTNVNNFIMILICIISTLSIIFVIILKKMRTICLYCSLDTVHKTKYNSPI